MWIPDRQRDQECGEQTDRQTTRRKDSWSEGRNEDDDKGTENDDEPRERRVHLKKEHNAFTASERY